MFERLSEKGREIEEKTKEHINEYADAGLRTLVLAYRELEEEEYMIFNEKLNEAKNSMNAEREEMIEEIQDSIEKELVLLGATAVEDKLQNGVCLQNFIQSAMNLNLKQLAFFISVLHDSFCRCLNALIG